MTEELEIKAAGPKKKKEKKEFTEFVERVKPTLLEPFIEAWITRCRYIHGMVFLQCR